MDKSQAAFGVGVGPIYLDGLACSGGEDHLVDCFHRGVGVHSCGHNEDAGVVCRGKDATTALPIYVRNGDVYLHNLHCISQTFQGPCV